jgi:hypothetical protein
MTKKLLDVYVYKRTGPAYEPHLCKHEDLHTIHNGGGHWMGLFCAHCGSHWYMSDLGKALVLLEQKRLTAPD